MKPRLKPVVLGVVLRMRESCGLDAAQRQLFHAITTLVAAWMQRRMPARCCSTERACQKGLTN